MDVRVVRYGDCDSFLRRARPWLAQSEAEHNLILSVVEQLHAHAAAEEAYVATVEERGVVVGCALRTPPRKLIVTTMPDNAIPALVVDVAACYDRLPAVLGPVHVAREFARQWCERRSCRPRDGMAQRLYQLRRLVPPEPRVEGDLRLATARHTDLITSWINCFASEARLESHDARAIATARIAAGEMFLWFDEHARTLAGYSGSWPGGVRIGYVYTPPEWRGRGYAGACVAAVSRRALDQGARICCLYTDLSNPTSNAIYQRLGYEPVSDSMDVLLYDA